MILKHETTNIVVKPLPNFEVRGEMNEIEYIVKLNRVKEIFCKREPFMWPTHVQKYFYYFWKHLLTSQHHHTLWKTGIILNSQTPFHNLANISYTGILSGDLGVHIGVYLPWYSVLFSNTCYLIQLKKSRNQFTYLKKDTTLD